ncbi:hypothetical protein BD324DRAFT_652202 [Kockovaella imperatae]|uniref:Membrane-associated, eicosanoid/glutathione metabolism protein n=1 Tax=Kockovaella imperatae TaxID=4999 RepID=A0A1Y1UDQ9_9TREE|nr:hypothetical protein BD324DRAFT_652202 [Kockovaella imperatae]ORX35654.1 hypothetical protein BD324DRAFT_652202 [Kockovaella imperatae]
MSFAGLNTAHNFSFYAIPAAFGISLAPHLYAIALYNKERAAGTDAWDWNNPKKNLAGVKEAKLSPQMADRYARAEAANENGFSSLPLFAAAVIAGNVARIEPKALNSAVTVYLASRIAFNLIYINGTSALLGYARTISWWVSAGSCLSLFIQAGNKFYGNYAAF